jgi:hypothetical protein
MFKRLFAPTTVLLACLVLGSCSSFSGYVSDHWPTWAGGMPNDVPPRPGAPGYEEFISHQQGGNAPAPAAAAVPGAPPAAAPLPAAVNANTGTTAQVMPAVNRQPNDRAAVQGGLY